MQENLINVLKKLAKPLLGKGVIDRHFPYLITAFQLVYGSLQGSKIKTVSIPNGMRLKVYAGDIGMGFPLILKGSYEPKTTEVFLSLVKEGQVLFDIGANAGYYTILASKQVGSKGKVYSFEPDPQNASLVKQNVSLNDLKNVEVLEKALDQKSGASFFTPQKFNRGDSSLSPEGGKIKVETTSLDDFVDESNIKHVDLIIMDIEGAEILALKGGNKFLSEAKNLTLLIEYNPESIKKLGFSANELVEMLQTYGFKIESIVDEQKEAVIPFSEENLAKTIAHTTYCNLVCAK